MADTEIKKIESEQDAIDFLEEVFYDVQNHLHIVGKYETPTLPKYIAINKLPSIELFKDTLDEELARPDLTKEDRERMAAEEAQKIKEEQDRIKAEEEAKKKAEEEARLKAEQEKFEAEQKAKEEQERLEKERLEAERLQKEEEEKQRAEEEARLKAEEEARQKEEQERLEAEQKAKEDEEIIEEETIQEEEEEQTPSPAPQQQTISVISFETLKGKKKPLAKKSIMQGGGISAAIMAKAQEKEELDAIKKEDAKEKAAYLQYYSWYRY